MTGDLFKHMVDHPKLHIPFILLVCFLLYFALLGSRDFWNHENDYAEITRVMILDGEYLVPKLNGELWSNTPILYFWLAGLVSWLFGQVNEWTIRLPSATAATALMWVFYFFVKKRFGSRIAFLGTLVLATCLLTVHAERHIPVNLLFFLFVSLTLFFAMEVLVFNSIHGFIVYGAWFFMGLACLTKGPLAVLIPATTILLYLQFSDRWTAVLSLRPFSGALIFLAVSVPWFAYVTWQTSGAWMSAFLAHQSVFHNLGQHGPGLKPAEYYGFNFFAGFIPWIFFFVPMILSLWPDRAKMRRGPSLFLLLWFLSALLLAPVSEGQHGHDLYIGFPPAALAMAVYLERLIFDSPGELVQKWTGRSVRFISVVLIASGLSAPFVASYFYRWSTHHASLLGAIGLAYIVEAVWMLYALKRRDYQSVVVGFALFGIVSNLMLHLFVFPALNLLKPRAFAQKVGTLVATGGQLAVYKHGGFTQLNFYSGVGRIEFLHTPAQAQDFLSRTGVKFLLVKEAVRRELQSHQEGRLITVLHEAIGAQNWLLLRSCDGACESLRSASDLTIE
jgi:4-amino-4-deoxy-L-arabinose transferase-like glycosyltransferase